VEAGTSGSGFLDFAEMLRARSKDTGMAFIFVQHMDPTCDSLLAPLLGRKSVLPVSRVPNRKPSVHNRLSLTPPNTKVGIYKLQREVTATREYLRIIDDKESTNEELKSSNDEALSNKAELRSAREELEIVKEELQSSREELSSLAGLQSDLCIELSQLNDDLTNVLDAVQIPILILGGDRRIRRFSLPAEKMFNLLPTDRGKSIQHIKHNLDLLDLESLISSVIESLVCQEREVRDLDGKYYSMSVRPYRTSDGRIDGAVIALVDTDGIKRSLLEAERSRDYASAIVDTIREPLVVLDSTLRMVTANRSFCETFQVSQDEVGRCGLFDVADGGWELREVLGKIRLGQARYRDVRVTRVLPSMGSKTLLLNARRIERDGHLPGMILLAMEDVTEQESTTEALRQSHERLGDLKVGLLNAQEGERRRISRELHDDFNQRLAMLVVELENLEKTPLLQSAEVPRSRLAVLRTRAEGISDDLRKMAHQLHPSVVEHLGLPSALRALCEEYTKQENIRIDYRQQGVVSLATPTDIAVCIYRIAQAALHNVAQHSGSNRATVNLAGGNRGIVLSVSDTGVGFDLEAARERSGLGIISMEERARMVIGRLTIRSKVGVGTRIAIEVPLPDGDLADKAS
jgi:two-component system CheB/CheR fusion protein